MKQLLGLLLLLIGGIVYGQDTYYGKYDWKEVPDKYVITEDDKKEDEVILFEKRSIEYARIGEEMVQMVLSHTIRLINTDAAIEENNKVYVNNGSGTNVFMQKARVIKPSGEIVVLKESDIQESKDEDGEVEYRYFALDGLEKGCIIEYIHYLRQEPDYTGSTMYLQNALLKKKVEYDIISPKHLDFVIYPVNGMPEFILDTVDYFVRRKFMNTENVKGLKEESQSPYYALVQKCYYKLNKNFDSGKGNFYTYTAASKIIHETMFDVPSKKALKKIKALIKEVELKGGSNLEDKLRYLEFKIKSEYQVLDADVPQLSNLDFIFEKKITSDRGMTKLFIQTLRAMGVKFELVLTSNRDENPFITEFEGYNFLDEYLVYVNELDKYWAPDIFSRLGFPPFELTYTKGLFIEERILNELAIPIAKVKEIKLVSADQSVDAITAEVDFTESMDEPKIVIERKVTGYKAQYPQYILDFIEEDRKIEAKEDFLKYIDKDSKLEDTSYQNDNSKAAGKLPFIAKARFVGNSFIERAGEKTLLKVGMLIGPQAELYNKDERTQPVQAEFNRQYQRKITVIIPEGMVVKNLNELNFNVKTNDEAAGFTSSYVLTGNTLTITVSEFYNKVYFPVAEYKGYESVMNAAADFNKLVLVMEKL
jgi:hypothetical protein